MCNTNLSLYFLGTPFLFLFTLSFFFDIITSRKQTPKLQKEMNNMKNVKKKTASLFFAAVILLSALSIGTSAFAASIPLALDVLMTQAISGAEDKVQFVYTPEASGTYCLKGYSNYDTEAYLFVRETVGTDRVFTQLAYNDDDPDGDSDHSSTQFKLVYFLEAGTKYYFEVGFYNDARISGDIKVILTCLAYADSSVDSISAVCNAHLNYYSNGTWKTDANGVSYFHYNISTLIQNTTVTVNYTDGTSLTAPTGATSINGITIVFVDPQNTNHWAYFDSSTGTVSTDNILTVKYLDKTYDLNIIIDTPPLYSFSGKIVNYNATDIPVTDGKILINGAVVTETNSKGEFSFSYPSGSYTLVFTSKYGIPRTVIVIVSTQTVVCQTPVPIISTDLNFDGIVNARDYSKFLNNPSISSKEALKAQFLLTSDVYTPLTIS